MKVKVGDKVRILAGKDRGKEGKILVTLKKKDKVVVEGINIVKKHMKPSQQNETGGILSVEAPIHVSNVAYLDPVKKVPTKVGYKIENGVKYRVAKKSDTVIDTVIDYNKKAANAAKNN